MASRDAGVRRQCRRLRSSRAVGCRPMSRSKGSDSVGSKVATKYLGWARLNPLGADPGDCDVVPFVFPLDLQNRYGVGTRNSDAIDLLLPHDDENAPAVEAALRVNKRGEALLDRSPGLNAAVTVNGEALRAGGTWRLPLSHGCKIKFGRYSFTFENCDEILSDLDRIAWCHVCSENGRAGLRVLGCGHNICVTCRREAEPPIPRSRILRNEGEQGQQQQRLSAIVNRVIPSTMPASCIACQRSISAQMAISAIGSLTAAQVTMLSEDIKNLEASCPLCDQCGNKRGLLTARDYDHCQQCGQTVCAACALQWHRNHHLTRRIDHLRAIDEANFKMATAEREIAVVERLEQDTLDDETNERIARAGGHGGNAMIRKMHSLSQKVLQCQYQLGCIQQRRRAVACGLDKTSCEMMSVFEKYVKEIYEIQQFIAGLKTGEVSLTISSSSSEDETRWSTRAEEPSASGSE